MPIYVYRCLACDNAHEALQKFSDPVLTICPSCGGPLQKQFTPEVGLSFKGRGFYITDYVKNKNGDKSTSRDPEKAKSESPAKAAA